jgi:hypothetical protein
MVTRKFADHARVTAICEDLREALEVAPEETAVVLQAMLERMRERRIYPDGISPANQRM